MAGDQGEHGPRWHEGYQLGLRDALTGGITLICGGEEAAEMTKGYWAGREAGLHQREAAPEAGL
jgi:hypothetical protein